MSILLKLTKPDPFIALQTLHILRNLYFISSRSDASAFSQYSFVYLTAIDILSQYPVQAEAFLKEIRPSDIGHISDHPMERCFDLYFLNTSEHFPLVLSVDTNEDVLIKAATPYLGLGADQRLFEIFEAAHSVMLAVFAAPRCTDLTIRHIHGYFEALFKVCTVRLVGDYTDNVLSGFPPTALCPTVSDGRENAHSYHCATFPHIRNTATAAVNTVGTRTSPHTKRRVRTLTRIITISIVKSGQQPATCSLRTIGPCTDVDRCLAFPIHCGSGRLASCGGPLSYCDPE